MRKMLFGVVCLLAACNTPSPSGGAKDAVIGKVEIYDSAAASIIDTNAVIEVIGRHYKWSEGPVWVPGKNLLLFSAVRENKIYSWDGKDTPVVYLDRKSVV